MSTLKVVRGYYIDSDGSKKDIYTKSDSTVTSTIQLLAKDYRDKGRVEAFVFDEMNQSLDKNLGYYNKNEIAGAGPIEVGYLISNDKKVKILG